MSNLEAVKIIPRSIYSDDRGWLLKAIAGNEPHLGKEIGEFYVTSTLPGQVRGNHYHKLTNEWFTVIVGQIILVVGDERAINLREIRLASDNPATVFVPAGIAHAFLVPANISEEVILVAYADRTYDPLDTFPVKLI